MRFGTTDHIKRHINKLQYGELFTTRDLLTYGSRGSVDQALYRCIEEGYAVRLARGVFIKGFVIKREVSLLEVAQAKARAFGRTPVSDCQRPEHLSVATIETTSADGKPVFILPVSGASSSFQYKGTRIVLRGVKHR